MYFEFVVFLLSIDGNIHVEACLSWVLMVIFIFRTQVGSQPITSVAWLTTLRLLVTLSRDGNLQVWKTRVIVNLNTPPMPSSFFEPAG